NDMSEQAPVIGAHGLRRANPDLLDGFNAGPAVEDDGKRGNEAYQQDGREVAEPEPEQEQRRIGEAGYGGADRYERQKNILGTARAAHQHADGDADDGGERKTGEQANDCFDGVMREDARNRQIHKRSGNLFECREKPARKNTAPGNDLPDCADDNERKNISPDHPQAVAALRSIGCIFGSDDSNGVLHPGPRSSTVWAT